VSRQHHIQKKALKCQQQRARDSGGANLPENIPLSVHEIASPDAIWITPARNNVNLKGDTSYIGHGQYESIPMRIRIASVLRPATTALFGDGQWSGGANKFMRALFPSPGDASFTGRWARTQGIATLARPT
jgi:hypothetical protein